MPKLHYGQTIIDWRFQLDTELKRHYLTVERGQPVLLRGPMVDLAKQEDLVKKRAKWIREKLILVNKPQEDNDIVTGSRLRYFGRSYYTEVRHAPTLTEPTLIFTASRFIIESPWGTELALEQLAPLLENFYYERAKEKLLPRVRRFERETGLKCADIRIRHFQSRWASCDESDVIQFHPKVMELARTVQDYIIIHELCHTIEKNHTKAFWDLVAQCMPDWKKKHEALERSGSTDTI